ncbi:unnamed protein product [Coccothraustes coccothraustes]
MQIELWGGSRRQEAVNCQLLPNKGHDEGGAAREWTLAHTAGARTADGQGKEGGGSGGAVRADGPGHTAGAGSSGGRGPCAGELWGCKRPEALCWGSLLERPCSGCPAALRRHGMALWNQSPGAVLREGEPGGTRVVPEPPLPRACRTSPPSETIPGNAAW